MGKRKRVVVTALLCGCVLLLWSQRAWLSSLASRPTKEERESGVRHLSLDGTYPVTSEYRVRSVTAQGSRDQSWWYLFEIPPAEVATYRAAVVRHFTDSSRYRIESGTDLSRLWVPGGPGPLWWKPTALGDAQFIKIDIRADSTDKAPAFILIYIFSPSSGRIYFHPWSVL
jgi:hypothetical protein